MAKLGFANLTSLLFNFLTISNIIYNKQSSYDQLTFRNNWNAHYDYIIIGAGTSGSVLAARLTEDPDVTVLLLEAGGSETVTSNTPGLSETLIGTVMDWKSLTVPQNHSCLAMNGQQCHLASGRVIGGTSSINRMYYLRGNPNDFDVWQQKFGLKSWSWKDVFPFMIRNENQKDPERAKSGHYGLNGPVCIEQINKSSTDLPENKILDSFLAACQQVGYRNIDLNTGVQQGSSLLQSTIHNGKRQSMSSAFLEPNFKTRQNLHILANSVAMNVLWENDRAIGVKFYRDWQQYSVFARQEVIISAGTLFSPKILQLSGVGPRHDLNRLGIQVVADLPVGDNLHDHVGTLGLYFVANQLPESSITKQHLKQYFYYGKGPLAESKYGAAVFPATKKSTTESTFHRQFNHPIAIPSGSPDLMLLTYLNGLTNRELSAELTEQQINLKRSIWNQYYGEKLKLNNGKLQFTIIPMVLKPKSRGRIRLKSTNPMDMPLIDPNYFDHPDDLEQLAQAMREALRLARTKPFEQYDTQWYRTVVPGCETEFQKFQTEFDTMFNNVQPAQDDLNDAYHHGMENHEPIIGHSEMKPILTFIEDYFNNGGQMVDGQQQSTTTSASIITTPSTVDKNRPPQPPSSTSGTSGGGSGGNGGYSNNLPFHFMSSFVSKLFRRSSLKKFQKAVDAKRKRSRQSRQQYNANPANHPFYYDQYWLGNGDPKSMIHPLINKTIYGGLVDGFSSASASTSTSSQNTDQSVITVWNNHRDRKHPRPLPAMEDMKTTTGTASITSDQASLADILPPDVQPIVLTGFFQSPPKPQGQIVAIKDSTASENNHHHLHYHHHHRPELPPPNRVTPSSAIVSSAAPSKLPAAQSSKSSSSQSNQSRNDNGNHHHHHVDAYLKCMARQLTMPIGDYVGTCRMGVQGDRKRVVDERFRVVGVRGLRVIDCSVVPEITTGGLAPVAIMLGERGAEFIREDRKQMKLKT